MIRRRKEGDKIPQRGLAWSESDVEATDYNLKFSFLKKQVTCRGCVRNNHLGLFVCKVALTLVEAGDNSTSVP